MNMTSIHIDALKEIINIGVGRAAAMLNEMLDTHIDLQVPFVKILRSTELKKEIGNFGNGRFASVRLVFKDSFSGSASLVFPPDSAAKLVAILTGEELGTPDLDSVRLGTLSEVGNIVINGVMGSIGNVLKKTIHYSLPTYVEDTIGNLLESGNSNSDATVMLAQTRFNIERFQIEGDIILLFEVGSFDTLLTAIDTINLGSGG